MNLPDSQAPRTRPARTQAAARTSRPKSTTHRVGANRLAHVFAWALLACTVGCAGTGQTRIVPIARGWADNSINAVIFRQHAVTTFGPWQYTAFYDEQSRVVLAKRRLDATEWDLHITQYTGNTRDAHNTICIAVDGTGRLHAAWDHHNHDLRYARGATPGMLRLMDRQSMTGTNEDRVCYPEFYNLVDGGLVFMYRSGAAGRGDTMLNRYSTRTGQWSVVQHPLIAGEGERNAYPNQLVIDDRGTWHLSWNWREQGGVQTNHDLCYARSTDEGATWTNSTGKPYALPITQATAEIVCAIPQEHELINHTTMAVDSQGRPMIATYWRPEGADVPQYHLVWQDGQQWHTTQVSRRTTPFRLSGGGTKRIPISRPKLAVDDHDRVYMVFRDTERGDRVSVAICTDSQRRHWRMVDLTEQSVGMWEPNYDSLLWQREGVMHLFLQRVGQGDGEKLENLGPQMVSILEWTPPR